MERNVFGIPTDHLGCACDWIEVVGEYESIGRYLCIMFRWTCDNPTLLFLKTSKYFDETERWEVARTRVRIRKHMKSSSDSEKVVAWQS